MQLTIDVKDSVVDKVMYLLNSLKSDVKIINKTETNSLDIQAITEDEEDYQYILKGREERKNGSQNYGNMNDINWD
ncbi:MAG: hypothetical protein U9R50_07125 [Campylobacterota bacterium]|nr:hypothetical protein [Campylobacterota bacterium]